MRLISFKELGAIKGFKVPTQIEIDSMDPTTCPARGEAQTCKQNKLTSAICQILSKETGDVVGVDLDTCQVCMCNGPAEPSKNPALQKHICQIGYSKSIATLTATEAKKVTVTILDIAIANIKRWKGKEIAKQFIDTLVYHETVTPKKGADLANSLLINELKE